MVGDQTNATPKDEADRFEERLFETPIELPDIRSLGLPEDSVDLLEKDSELWSYVQRTVAAELVIEHEWDTKDADRLQQAIVAYQAPGGREAFERGLRPGELDPFLALMACLPFQWGVVPPESVIPQPYRGQHPAKLVYYWPEPEDAFSDAALANFRLLDDTMREAFEVRWYGHGLPHDTHFMVCLVAEWDRGLADTPFTSMPGPDVFLPEDKQEFYDELTDHEKWATELNLAADILKGRVWFHRSRFGQTETVSTLAPTEEFLEGLRFAGEGWLCGFYPAACR